MRNRIGKLLDDGLVHLGLVAVGDEPNLLAKPARYIADEPRHAREDGPDRLHPDRHHAFLQLPGLGGEFLAALGPLVALPAAAFGKLLGEHRLRDDKLADHVHEPVDARQVDPDECRAFGRMRRGIDLVRLRGLRRVCPIRLTAGSFLLAARLFDLEEAFLVDELEHLGHRGFGRLGGEMEDEGQVGGLGIEMGQVRQFGCVALDPQLAQVLQLPDQEERLVRMPEQLAMGLEDDPVGTEVLLLFLRGLRWSGSGGFLVCRAKQLMKLRNHACPVACRQGARAPRRIDKLRQEIRAPDDHAEELRATLNAVAAQLVEQRLEDMRELDQLREIERRGTGLDRMNRPENRVQSLAVDVSGLQGRLALFEILQDLGTLLKKCGLESLRIG